MWNMGQRSGARGRSRPQAASHSAPSCARGPGPSAPWAMEASSAWYRSSVPSPSPSAGSGRGEGLRGRSGGGRRGGCGSGGGRGALAVRLRDVAAAAGGGFDGPGTVDDCTMATRTPASRVPAEGEGRAMSGSGNLFFVLRPRWRSPLTSQYSR